MVSHSTGPESNLPICQLFVTTCMSKKSRICGSMNSNKKAYVDQWTSFIYLSIWNYNRRSLGFHLCCMGTCPPPKMSCISCVPAFWGLWNSSETFPIHRGLCWRLGDFWAVPWMYPSKSGISQERPSTNQGLLDLPCPAQLTLKQKLIKNLT